MTQLSVNINKIATLRNARGGNNPDVVRVALDCESYGAQGITVHPRPDERHIRHQDVYNLKKVLSTEFNIEGNPTPEFLALVLDIKPAQVTFVPDAVDQLTSNHGWDTVQHLEFLSRVTTQCREAGIRVSIFVNPEERMVEYAAKAGADRVEFYTEPYASGYAANREQAAAPYIKAAQVARKVGLGMNAGHDLSLENLEYLHQQIPDLAEVSIGHALICDALYMGLENTIHSYLHALSNP